MNSWNFHIKIVETLFRNRSLDRQNAESPTQQSSQSYILIVSLTSIMKSNYTTKLF